MLVCLRLDSPKADLEAKMWMQIVNLGANLGKELLRGIRKENIEGREDHEVHVIAEWRRRLGPTREA